MALVGSRPIRDGFRSSSHCNSVCGTQATSPNLPITPPLPFNSPDAGKEFGSSLNNVELAAKLDELHMEGMENWDALDKIAALGLTLNDGRPSLESAVALPPFSIDMYKQPPPSPLSEPALVGSSPLSNEKGPFHKWMKTLHRRAAGRDTLGSSNTENLPWQYFDTGDKLTIPRRIDHGKSSSGGSSFGFVAAVRSTSVSLASFSVVGRSRRTATGRSRGFSRGERSSRASSSVPRFSEDSTFLERQPATDPPAVERSLQRRRILEELISTEECYISDVRFLMNVRQRTKRLASVLTKPGLCHFAGISTYATRWPPIFH